MPFGLGPQRSTLVPSFCTSTAETNVQVPTRSLAIWAAALPVGSAAPRNASDSVATASVNSRFMLFLPELLSLNRYSRISAKQILPLRLGLFSRVVRPDRIPIAIWRCSSLRDLDQGHGIDQAVGQHEVAVPGDRGVAHDVAATRDGPTLEFGSLGIEAHDHIRCRSGLAVPDDVVDRRDAVGLGLRPARRLPLAHLAGRGIETTQIPAREVAVPHDVVAGDRETPWAGRRIRQYVLTNFQRLRIDTRHPIGTEQDDENGALRIHRHAIGARLRRRRREQLDLAGLGVEPPHPVGILRREPQDSNRVGRRSEEHTSELQSLAYLVCRLLLEKKKT